MHVLGTCGFCYRAILGWKVNNYKHAVTKSTKNSGLTGAGSGSWVAVGSAQVGHPAP